MVGVRKRILPFFLWWVIPTIIVLNLPVPQTFTAIQLNLVVLFFTGFYLLLASSLSHRIIIEVFEEERETLFLIICFSVLLFCLLYIYVRLFGHSSNIVASISTANLLFVATVIGAGLSSAVTRVAELVPICVTAAIADLMSVLKGPTKEMIKNISTYYEEGMTGVPPIVDFIVIKVGVPGFVVPMPLFGVTDWVLITIISSAMIRLRKSDNLLITPGRLGNTLYFPVATAALFLGLVFAQATNMFFPAMVFISTIFLLYLLMKHKVHKEMGKLDILYSFAFPAVVVLLVFVFFR